MKQSARWRNRIWIFESLSTFAAQTYCIFGLILVTVSMYCSYKYYVKNLLNRAAVNAVVTLAIRLLLLFLFIKMLF